MSNEYHEMSPIDFESDFLITEIFPEKRFPKVEQAFQLLGLTDFCVTGLDGKILFGSHQHSDDSACFDLAPELEPIAYLYCAKAHEAIAKGAAAMFVQLLQSEWRYHMASDMHLKAMKADYDALMEKHQLLQKSEQNYKELSENLEVKVQEQVKTIEMTQRQLYESEKMTSVGQLASGVAHEINNPIGFINSNLKTAKDYVDELEEWYGKLSDNVKDDDITDVFEDFGELLGECIHGASRVTSIVADLKAYSDIDYTEEHTIDIQETVDRVARIFDTQHEKTINVETQIQPNLKLLCKSGYFNQMLLNLLMNSGDAIEEKGAIKISARLKDEWVQIAIQDTGCGIPDDLLKRVFDPFFTTHDVGGGTGLGLTVARDIARAHGGDLSISSKVGEGARVIISIPTK